MKKDNVALTPPMGWNSRDCYGPAVNEEQLPGNAPYLAGHFKEYRWEDVRRGHPAHQPNAGQARPH